MTRSFGLKTDRSRVSLSARFYLAISDALPRDLSLNMLLRKASTAAAAAKMLL
ncbi:hypothetical protein [Mesorhizobium sp. LMG 17147]|uniref:hypothetical protein n=1 Tax=Mesorhizobium sp. LMG 17147 TaxID=2963091 RepID=UPI0020C9B321|nr:hypothetical protein [Mesorhizobium sp. LMG 17147]